MIHRIRDQFDRLCESISLEELKNNTEVKLKIIAIKKTLIAMGVAHSSKKLPYRRPMHYGKRRSK